MDGVATTSSARWRPSDSPAFREASLRSETRRAYAVLSVMVLIILLLILPDARRMDTSIRFVGTAGIAALAVLQLAVLLLARWARRRERPLPVWIVATTVVIETLIPTGMCLAQIVYAKLLPFAALSAPPLLAYGLLIALTTLRLRPALCVLAGLVSGASYGCLIAYVYYGIGIQRPNTGLPVAAYVNSAVLMFITGVGCAWVAKEIRGHMEAALGEARTRMQMARIEQDLAVARSIQQALLPREAPNIPGFDIAGWNRSADQTGGDYYDWQEVPGGGWLVTLADVSGHGVGPALVTAACRAYMRADSRHHADLESLTSRVNQLLAEDLPDGRFVTMAAVHVNPRDGGLTLLSAGHGPIVVYASASGEVRNIMPKDLPLAVVPDAVFGPAEAVTLRTGDVLALVTDGFVEWARPSEGETREDFGIERLHESLRRHAHLAAAGVIDAVAADVAAFAGAAPQQDDLTMVVIKRTG